MTNTPERKILDVAHKWNAAKGHFKTLMPLVRAGFIALLTRSLFPAIVAMVGAVAGLAASVYSAELKAAIPMFRRSAAWSEYSSDAITAAGLFVLFFILYASAADGKEYAGS